MFRSLLSHKYVREFLVQDVLYLQSVIHGSGAMERRIDELEGRLAAINDKLSGVVNQFNDGKQNFKDETCPTKACSTRGSRRST